MINMDEVIGKVEITWTMQDLNDAFYNTFNRDATEEELNDFKDFLGCDGMNNVGGETAMEIGWHKIYCALEDYAKENNMETN